MNSSHFLTQIMNIERLQLLKTSLLLLLLMLSIPVVWSAKPGTMSPPGYIPSRAIVLHGNPNAADSAVIAVFYSREGLDFSDAGAPRFLLLDREGKVAFGIGGSLYATASYDFMGSVDSYDFTTYDISVPNNPTSRERFGADARNSSLFAKLVGKSSRFGIFTVYLQAKFTGDAGNYGFKLKQAYVTLGHMTAGLATSTFVDADVQAPTIDPQGACGQITEKNMLFRYTTPARRGFKGAISVEVPSASYTVANAPNGDALSKKISQRVPDIPLYLQYGWGKESHVRVSGIFRTLAYRDLVTNDNHLKTCWGVKGSAIVECGMFSPFGHISYGKGISSYVNDLSGNGFDLTPDFDRPGRMIATPSMTWTVGTYLYFAPKWFATGSLSRAQAFDCAGMGGDTYRYSMYAAANVFYDFDDNFRLGAEYLHGKRMDYNGVSGTANRFNLLLQYSF